MGEGKGGKGGEVGRGEGEQYQACSNPGKYPRQQSARLMSESAVQIPFLIQTAMGGKRMARRARGRSEVHIGAVRGVSVGSGRR